MLYEDRVVEVVAFTLKRRAASGTDTFYVSQDYWDAGTLYSGSPVIYPLLAQPTVCQRSITDGVLANRHDVTVVLYGKTHFDRYGRRFLDIAESHDMRRGDCVIYRYRKSEDQLGTPLSTDGIRQTLVVRSYLEQNDLMQIVCRDAWFEDKEVSRRLNPAHFDDLHEESHWEYGAIPFGEGGSNGGPVINSPRIKDENGPSNFFCGFRFPNHAVHSLQKTFVQNQTQQLDPREWLELGWLGGAGAWHGTINPTSVGSQFPRHLSLYSRGLVASPAQTRLITAINIRTQPPMNYWCADFAGSNNLYIIDPNGVSPNGTDFTIAGWVRFDQVRSQPIIGKGDLTNLMEWGLYMNSAGRIAIHISSTGAAVTNTVTHPTILAANTWYWITAWYNAGANTLNVSIDNGAATSGGAGGAGIFRGQGPLQMGYTAGFANHLDGRAAMFGYWAGVLGTTEKNGIYNSGNGKAYEDLTDGEKVRLVSWWNLSEFRGQRRDSHSSRHFSDAGSVTSIAGKIARSIDFSKGEVRVSVHSARFLSDTGSFATETLLRTSILDTVTPGLSLYAYETEFPIDPPLPISPNVSYFFTAEFTNHNAHQYSYWSDYGSVVGQTHYARLNEERGSAWVPQANTQLSMAIYAAGAITFEQDTTNQFAYLRAWRGQGSIISGVPFPALSKGLNLKTSVRGLRDDASGTYTGSASSVMKNPSDLIRFLLMSSTFGLGLTSSQVDTAALTTTRGLLGSNHSMCFPVDTETWAGELLYKLCKQTDSAIYKSRRGLLRHHYPQWHGGQFTVDLFEGRLQDEMRVVNIADTPNEVVYNDFSINYGVDQLNLSKDPALIRRAGSHVFSANVYLNDTESSSDDTVRQARLAASRAKYGQLQYREDFDLYPDDSPAPLIVMNRLADRHYDKAKQVTIALPLKDYFARDLFDTVRARHTELPREGGARKTIRWRTSTGAKVRWKHNGIPVHWMRCGHMVGSLVGVLETEQRVELTYVTETGY